MKPEIYMFAGLMIILLAAQWAINTQIWTECTAAGMSGFYCFMQGI